MNRISRSRDESQGKIDSGIKPWRYGSGYRRKRTRSSQNSITEAIDHVIVHHSYRLHEGVADGRSDEVETAPLKVFAHGIGLGRARRNFLERPGRAQARLAVYELPDIAIEAAKFLLHREECFRVRDGRGNLEFVADNPGIPQ